MKNFNSENINRIISDFKCDRKNYFDNIKKQKGINKITKRLPNFFTKLRFLAPLVIFLSIRDYLLSLKIISLFAITDVLDGFCARKFDAYSEYGRKLDTISDKIFAIGIGLPIALINTSLIPIVLFEVMIGLVNVSSELKNNNPHSTKLGKLKTWFTFTTLITGYGINIINLPKNLLSILIILTNILEVSTLTQYLYIDHQKDQVKTFENIETCVTNSDTKDKIKELKELKNHLNNIKNINNETDVKQKQKTI